MTDVTAHAARFSGRPDMKRALIIGALFVATLATTALFPLFPQFFRPASGGEHASLLILGWLSTAHVAATAFFYVDSDFSAHIRARPWRYIWAPLLFVIGCALAWGATGNSGARILWFVFVSWLLWHYQRQNLGICSLISASTGGTPLTKAERVVIMAAGVGGIIGALRFGAAIKADLDPLFLIVGGAVYGSSCLAAAWLVWQRLRSGANNRASASFFICSIIFFLPTFLANAYWPAVTGYAVAHALQYWVLMTMLSTASASKDGWLRAVGGTAVLVVAIWGVIALSRNGDLWGRWAPWLFGLQFGITMAHFVIDADAWRLREPFQRGFVKQRLGALLR